MKVEGNTVSISRILMIGGAFIALLIGSGFTTGQEIMQYFVAYQQAGIASIIVMFCLFVYVSVSFIMVGHEQRFNEPRYIYRYYCGRVVGNFFDWFSVAFLFMSFWVMVAGAGATMNQQFGWPTWYGGVAMGGMTLVTLLFGFNRLIGIVGSIGPLLSFLAILIGVIGIVMGTGEISAAWDTVPALVEQGSILQAGSNWFMACISYVGFCMLWLAVFMTNLGKTTRNRAEANRGAILGVLLFSLAVLAMMLGLSAHLNEVASAQIPTLVLVEKISPEWSLLFAVVIFIAIYTTAAPLLWTSVKRFAPDESSARHRLVLCVMCLAGTLVGLKVPFDALINVVYVLNGYVGFSLLFLMLVTDIRTRILKNYTPAVVREVHGR